MYLSIFLKSNKCFILPLKYWPNGHAMSNHRWFDVNITLIRWKENINEFRRYFDVLFHIISMGEKSTSSQRNFFDKISMCKKSTSLDILSSNLIIMSEKSILVDEKSTLLGCIFCWNLDEKLCNLSALLLMLFWKANNCGRFDILFGKLLIYWKLKLCEGPFWT